MIKNERGITLIILVITVIVLGIISIPTTLKISEIIELNQLTKHKDDFTIISETVSQVYSPDMSISGIGPRYNGELNFEKNPNDNSVYYVINMDKLNNDLYNKVEARIGTINFGESNYFMDRITEDVYIINEQSRTIYYVAGYEDANGETIYSYPGSYTKITVENY